MEEGRETMLPENVTPEYERTNVDDGENVAAIDPEGGRNEH